MQITFKSSKLEKQLTIPKEIQKSFGDRAKKVSQRMAELRASQNLFIVSLIPAAKFHPLKGDRKGEYAVTISGNFRLVMVPDYDEVPLLADGGHDLSGIEKIKIIDVEDYH
jgi:proteic killer suppression protein